MPTELQQAMLAYMDASNSGDGLFSTAVEGLTLMRTSQKTLPNHLIYRPELCLVVQGAKSIMLGDEVIEYRTMQALVVSLALPAIGGVVEASPERPLLVMALQLDLALLQEVTRQLHQPPASAMMAASAFMCMRWARRWLIACCG